MRMEMLSIQMCTIMNPSGNNDAPLKEVYKPDGADSILDVVNNNKEWKGNLQQGISVFVCSTGTIQ